MVFDPPYFVLKTYVKKLLSSVCRALLWPLPRLVLTVFPLPLRTVFLLLRLMMMIVMGVWCPCNYDCDCDCDRFQPRLQ